MSLFFPRILSGALCYACVSLGVLFPAHAVAQSSTPRLSPAATILLDLFEARRPMAAPLPGLTIENARAVQKEFASELQKQLGPVVGYKAALTNPAMRQRFGIAKPVYGVLFDRMLLFAADGAPVRVNVNYAAIPKLEGDLVVRVGSDRIRDAVEDQEILQCLESVHPFAELPDALFASQFRPDVQHLVAANAGARLGVVGPAIPLTPDAATLRRLDTFRVEAFAGDGKRVGAGAASDLLGGPIHAVRWLRDALKKDGVQLRKGDFLSLGSMTPPLDPIPGAGFELVYLGLADRPVSLRIEFQGNRKIPSNH